MRPPLISRNMANPNYDKRIEICREIIQMLISVNLTWNFFRSTRTVDIINIRRLCQIEK